MENNTRESANKAGFSKKFIRTAGNVGEITLAPPPHTFAYFSNVARERKEV